jgi:hypothetical protein
MQRSFWLPAAVAAGLLFAPAMAGADNNTYSVYSCRDPLGTPNAAAGWTSSQVGNGVGVSNDCAAGGALSAVLTGLPVGGAAAGWRFDAPPGTRIVNFSALRQTIGIKPVNEPLDLAYLLETLSDNATLEDCSPGTGSSCVSDLTAPVSKQGLNGAAVQFRAVCADSGGACSGPLAVAFPQAIVGLADGLKPVVSKTHVLDDGDSSGTLRVRFDAADVGGGVYRTVVKVDGKTSRAAALAAAPCNDVFTQDADPYQFNVPVPCPASVNNAQASVSVKSLPAGPHGVELAVEDAAGNQTAVYGPVEFPLPNGPTGSSTTTDVLNIRNAKLRMWFVKAPKHGNSYTSHFGTRVVTRGRLVDRKGRPIQGARVDVFHIRKDGVRRLVKTGLKTRRRGRLTLILPLNVDTRTIEFAYRALRPGPITSRVRLRLKVLRNGKLYYRR